MVVWVVVAGASGACARFAVHRLAMRGGATGFPWATLVVNIAGSLALGVLVGVVLAHGVDDDVRTVVGTGFLGSFTTFSAFSSETFALFEDGMITSAVSYALGSVVAGVAAAALGLAVAGAL